LLAQKRLESRISALERQIAAAQAGAAAAKVAPDVKASAAPASVAAAAAEAKTDPTITGRLGELTERVRKAEDKTFKSFYEKYTAMESVLSGDVELRELALSTEMREAVLLSGFDDFAATAKLLEAAQALTPMLEQAKPPVEGLPAFEKGLRAREAATEALAERAAKVHREIDAFVDSYNEIINLLSQKFLAYNAQLSKCEQQLAS